MKFLRVTQMVRLDQICLKYYDDLKALPCLLEANPDVLKKDLLEPGDIIQLPSWEAPQEASQTGGLWF